MVKIRLMRVGMKGAPSYRVVIADARSPRDGRIVETIGWYNPLTDPSTIQIDEEKARHWLSVGAQPTDATHALLVRIGVLKTNKAAASAAKAAAKAKAQARAEGKADSEAKPAPKPRAAKTAKPATAAKAEGDKPTRSRAATKK